MKRIISIILILTIVFTGVACSSGQKEKETTASEVTTTTSTSTNDSREGDGKSIEEKKPVDNEALNPGFPDDSNLKGWIHYEYDDNDYLIKKTEYRDKDTIDRITIYERDDNNLPILEAELIGSDSSLINVNYYVRDEKGRVLEHHNGWSAAGDVLTYEYNEQDQLVVRTHYYSTQDKFKQWAASENRRPDYSLEDPSWEIVDREVIEYDVNGKKIHSVVTSLNAEGKVEYDFDGDRELRQVVYDGNGNIISEYTPTPSQSSYEYEYDSFGNIVKKVEYKDGEYYGETICEYDANNNVIYQKEDATDRSQPKEVWKEYSINGYLVRKYVCAALVQEVSYYQYDSHGNLVIEKKYDWNGEK